MAKYLLEEASARGKSEKINKINVKLQIFFPLALAGLPGRHITVMDFKKDSAIIHEDVISQLILHPEVKDRKIVSLSIVGAFRKGKSFLLDYMLRYLYATVSFAFSISNGI
jgi:hypothetical protein